MDLNFYDWLALYNNNFWRFYFKDQYFLQMHFDILNLTFANIFDNLCNLYKLPKDFFDIKITPVKVLFNKPLIYGIGYDYADNIIYGQRDQSYILSTLTDAEYLYDRPINPSLVLKKNIDFEYRQNRFIFKNDKIKKIKTYNDNNEIYGFVWAINGVVRTYNYATFLHPELNTIYNEASIYPLLKYLRLGPAKKYLVEFLGKYFETPYTLERERVENITKNEIITDKNIYSIPEGHMVTVQKNKVYESYTFLTDGIIYNDVNNLNFIPLIKESHGNITYIYNNPVDIQIVTKSDIPSCKLPIFTNKFYMREKSYPYKLAHILDPAGFDANKKYIPWISLQYKVNTLKFFWDKFLKYNYHIFKIKLYKLFSLEPLKILKKYKFLGSQLIFLIDYSIIDDKLIPKDSPIKEKQFILQGIYDKIKMKDNRVNFYSTDIFYV